MRFFSDVKKQAIAEGTYINDYQVGELLKNTLEDFTSTINYSYNPIFQMGSQYLVFHGDPAIKLNYRTTPDFYINEKTINFIRDHLYKKIGYLQKKN